MRASHCVLAGALLAAILPAQAQRQLHCGPGEECSITCYQDGMDEASEIFHRSNIDLLQVDLNARVLKLELRDRDEKSTGHDYFILGNEMSCTIENMRGVHD